MKINCKCGKTITKDLRPFKKMDFRPDIHFPDSTEAYFPEHVFLLSKKKKYKWSEEESGIQGYYRIFHYPEVITVSELSILPNIIPPFKEGEGCCNWSMGADLKCSCGTMLGYMYLDCYEGQTIDFLTRNIVRSYK